MKLPKFNIQSPKHLSLLLFGGSLDIVVREPVLNPDGSYVFIKSGAQKDCIKVKNQTKTVYISGLGLKPLESWQTKNPGVYQTNQNILSIISGESDDLL